MEPRIWSSDAFVDQIAMLIEQAGLDSCPPEGGLLANQLLELDSDRLTVLFETPSGGEGVRVQSQLGKKYIEQTGYVIVRHRSDQEAREHVWRIWKELFNGAVQNRLVGSTYYLLLEAADQPALLDRDAQNRYSYLFNFRAIKEPS